MYLIYLRLLSSYPQRALNLSRTMLNLSRFHAESFAALDERLATN